MVEHTDEHEKSQQRYQTMILATYLAFAALEPQLRNSTHFALPFDRDSRLPRQPALLQRKPHLPWRLGTVPLSFIDELIIYLYTVYSTVCIANF